MGAFTAASEICASNDAMQVDNPVWAFTLESVALGFHGIQDYNRADAFFREATRAFVTCYGEKSMPVVNVKKLLSDTLEAKQDLEGVIDIQQEIINLLEQDDFVDFKFELVMAQYASGRAHFQKERFDAATLMAERARSQLSKLDQSLSNVQFYIARCEELLGHVQTATGDKEAATDSYKAALQSFHRALGDKEFQKYPSVAYMLTSLGTLELGRGNVDKSLTLLTQAHQMMIKYPHPAQGSIEMLLHALGSALMHDKQFEAAIEVFLGIVAKSEDSVLQATSLLYITQANMLQSKCHETLESLEVTVDYFLEQEDKGQLASMFEDKLTECLAAVHGKFSSNFTDADKSIFKRIVDKVAKLKN
ncbi:Hypothetical Protein FCC1311_018792 [Hondaea fermentalgiana]|uniref:Uncharacterized protein n=1 Tax=Hondaea fermentalgiana TaxID=2315210 RepID=A0A2R5G3S0_9STRA|nr:Hypothetical Protein FCC1311_018792 [Hondaea fermentalgiana]|eukprot:GBG25660.1 Hypothetical Protein FCC1311_018792 [Hondaea fermentalgiana]